mgnify:FL=1
MFEFHVEIEGHIGAVVAGASIEGTGECFLDHIRCPSDFLLALLSPYIGPLLLSVIEFLDLLEQYFIPL